MLFFLKKGFQAPDAERYSLMNLIKRIGQFWCQLRDFLANIAFYTEIWNFSFGHFRELNFRGRGIFGPGTL